MTTELSVHAVHLGGMRVLAESGAHQVLTDYPLPSGDAVEGLTSLELLLASLATCALNSVLAILKRKLNQPVTRLTVHARGLRRNEHPTVLTQIALEFVIEGVVDSDAATKALAISEAQLCPVWNMLKPGTPIAASFRVIPDSCCVHSIDAERSNATATLPQGQTRTEKICEPVFEKEEA